MLGYAGGDPDTPSNLDSGPDVPHSLVVDAAYTWHAERPDPAPVRGHDHLRGARQGLHHAAPRRAGRAARHLRRARARGRHRVPDRPRHHRRRAAARARVRAGGLAHRPGPDQLLGLQHDRVLRPHQRYSAAVRAGQPGGQVAEFKDMVDALHGAGPGGHPRRGVQPHRRGQPARARRCASAAWTTRPTTGSSPATRAPTSTRPAPATRSTRATRRTLQLIMDSLRYWLTEMHVDGFRFDLAATLARQEGGFDARPRSSTWSPRTRWCPRPS